MYELESHLEWQRLFDLYHAMSDVELLQLSVELDNLTEIARDVLKRELSSRKLQIEASAPIVPNVSSGSLLHEQADVGHGNISLTTLFDALDTSKACESLEELEIPFEVRDVSSPQSGFGRTGNGPAVAFEFIVRQVDIDRAMAILRQKMGLFPLQEVAVADEPIDDGTITDLGYFGRRAEAEEVARVLEDAHVWHRIVINPDGIVENEDCFTLEVKEIDVIRAGELVEKVLNFPEE
jgi:hypothetical protein